MTAMPSIRRLWTIYRQTVLREGLGRYKRDHVQVLAQNAFYGGAQTVLQCLAHLLESGDYEAANRFIERHGRQLKAMRGEKPRARRH